MNIWFVFRIIIIPIVYIHVHAAGVTLIINDFQDPNSSAGISEEPDLTLVSAADLSSPPAVSEFHPLSPSPNKSHISLTSFEQHEKSILSESAEKPLLPKYVLPFLTVHFIGMQSGAQIIMSV